uniref:Putative actin-related protein 10 n=1 Tax=Corethrella appendiculata TaxID=1370023 RepID=U5EI79_9DIPT
MPLFDSLLQEKPAITFEIGNAFTKLGFAGESYPRIIIPSDITNCEHQTTKKVYDYDNEDQLYDQLVEFIKTIFFKYILVSPKDQKIVIVESVLNPTIIRENIAKVLFCHFEVASVYFVPTHLVVLTTLAVDTALVVDIGYKEAVVMPVYSGVQVLKAWEAQPLAAESIHDEIKKQLILNGIADEKLTDYVIEDIKVRTCFVTTADRAIKFRTNEAFQHCPDVDYPIKGDEVIQMPGILRETAFEVLFPDDNDHLGLPEIILNSILKCPLDMRQSLAENILLIGGSTMVPGLMSRLKTELLSLVNSDLYKDRLFVKIFKFHTAPSKPNFTAWLGGSIYGATDLVISRSISRENYAKSQKLPDWTNYDECRSHGRV